MAIRGVRSSVPFRVTNPKQVILEIKSAERLVNHLEEILKKLECMITAIQSQKRTLLDELTEDAKRACAQIEERTAKP